MTVSMTKWIKSGSLVLLLAMVLVIMMPPKKEAKAFCICCCICEIPPNIATQVLITARHTALREVVFGRANPVPYGVGRLGLYQTWFYEVFFLQNVAPALQMMTEQLVTTSMQQMMIIGGFFDAKIQLDTQRLLQERTAEAHKDYHPSIGMCEIGTNVRSLGQSTHNGNLTRQVLAKHYEDRMIGKQNSNAAGGPAYDLYGNDKTGETGRVNTFTKKFCERKDMNNTGAANTGLFFCSAAGKPLENADIDFTRTVMLPRVINFDFALPEENNNAEIFELSNYLYGHHVFQRPDKDIIPKKSANDEYLDMRSVIAKRSVAQNSFNAIVGMKARGSIDEDPYNNISPRGYSTDTYEFMANILKQLGMPDGEIQFYLGRPEENNQMSYYAQMEILSKKMYQRPEFYTNLYDKPANVKRMHASMKAIGLMLDRDIYDSQLRSEAMLSLLLETQVIRLQKDVEDKIKNMKQL